jgi:hypothetical protein
MVIKINRASEKHKPPIFINMTPRTRIDTRKLGLEETGTEKAGKRGNRENNKRNKRHHPEGELVDLIQTTSSRMQWEQKKEEREEQMLEKQDA